MDVRRRGALVALLALALAAPGSARAEEPDPPPPPPPPAPSGARRALAVTAAILPGAIVRGSGHWVVGERRTAKRLLLIEGVSLALVAAGGMPIVFSGAAGETIPGAALMLPGTAMFATSIIADVWGAAGGARIAGKPLTPDELVLSAGFKVVADPRVPFDQLATADVDVRRGRGLGAVSGWLGDGTWRAAATAGVRVAGPRPRRPPVTDGTSVDVTATLAEENRSAEDFAVTTLEAGVRGRLDLFHLGPSLRGSFVRGGMGLGSGRVRYTGTGAADWSGILTAHFAWGFTVGDGHDRALEAEVFYEHRRDTLAGGLTLPNTTNGFIGYFGATATGWRGLWGATATVEGGSAWIFSLAARYRIPEVSR